MKTPKGADLRARGRGREPDVWCITSEVSTRQPRREVEGAAGWKRLRTHTGALAVC